MLTRRDLLKYLGISIATTKSSPAFPRRGLGGGLVTEEISSRKPIVVSTWKFGLEANAAAWKILSAQGRALDAVEQGARVPEDDPTNHSVGRGGYPDRDGHVTLDASIMDEFGNCGSVGALEHIVHPISVARRVMEKTPHVMLVGEGALQFALQEGFPKEELLTEDSRKEWEKWKAEHHYTPNLNHDTLGILAMDASGNLSGACTTSGVAWKYRGRVGDSPIIGAGLFVDNEVGAATSTGLGESNIKIAGAHTVVEAIRHGATPTEACEEAVRRIAKKQANYKDFQVAYLAINRDGVPGAFAIQKGFEYAMTNAEGSKMVGGASLLL